MKAIQSVAYLGKKFTNTALGKTTNHATKYIAGFYFDVFCKKYRTNGLSFEIPVEQTTRAMRGRFAADTYELPERELILKYLSPDACVLDLGGCIGVVSCIANRILRDSKAHVVVEANPFLIPVLERNRDANGAQFAIEHCIVSRAPLATLTVAANMDSSKRGEQGVTVPTRTLESIEDSYQISFNTLIMDIEGAEEEFILENKPTLRRIQLLIIEFHPGVLGAAKVDELRKVLIDCGLQRVEGKLTTEAYRRL